MSRLNAKVVTLPEKVEVALSGDQLTVRGPLGELRRPWPEILSLATADGQVRVQPKRALADAPALTGTYFSHLENMIEGVTKGFTKRLVIEGVGFRMAVNAQKLVLNIGFSHPVEVPIPEGVKAVVEKNVLTVSGLDKELVGQFAAVVRAQKKPEPYKGKGIRYEDEVIRRKEGKKVVS